MAVTLKEWVQDEWKRPGVTRYRDSGDFYDAAGLLPSLDRGCLERLAAWSAPLSYPTGFDQVRAIFYDAAQDRVVFVGRSAGKLSTCYTGSAWTFSGVTDIIAALSDLGGLHGRNCAYWGGHLYLIGSDGDVYRGASYTGALTGFYTGGDARLLAPYGDRLYMAAEDGTLYRLDSAGSAFETHYDGVGELDIRCLSGYRAYLYAVARSPTGTLDLLRIDPASAAAVTLQVVAQVPAHGTEQTGTCPFAQLGDRLYFSPGPYLGPDSLPRFPVYAWRYSEAGSVDHVAEITLKDANSRVSLLPWRGEMLIARLISKASGTAAHSLELLRCGSTFDAFPLTTGDVVSASPLAANAGGHLLLAGDAACSHAGPGTGCQDGWLETPHIDCGRPALEKRLDTVTLLTGTPLNANHTVTLKYRADDSLAWTTAGSAASTRRVTVGDLGVTFHTLQLRIELSDAGAQPLTLDALSLLYTIST